MVKTIIGSVSHGTMLEEDLIPCFIDLLSELNEDRSLSLPYGASAELTAQYVAEFTRLDNLLAEIEQRQQSDDYYESEDASYDLNEVLFNELENFAPPYFYFGAHPGDGSDYGFWLSEDAIECSFDGLRVADLSEVPDDYAGEVLFVNDHGNMSLYVADAGKLSEVWAIV